MTKKDLTEISKSILAEPGVYRFLDSSGTILYVKKAKSLKNRLLSYINAQKGQHNYTKFMVGACVYWVLSY